jgi:hypothetical protein
MTPLIYFIGSERAHSSDQVSQGQSRGSGKTRAVRLHARADLVQSRHAVRVPRVLPTAGEVQAQAHRRVRMQHYQCEYKLIMTISCKRKAKIYSS